MIFCDHQSRGLYVSLILISSIDNFLSKDLNMFEEKEKIYLCAFVSSISKKRAFTCFDLRAVRFIFLTQLSPPIPPPFPCDLDMYIDSNISPSVFGGCISALSSILSRRQLQTRRPITVSAMRELPFFEIACKYLDLILFAGNYAYRKLLHL